MRQNEFNIEIHTDVGQEAMRWNSSWILKDRKALDSVELGGNP